MDTELELKLDLVTAHRQSRLQYAQEIIENKNYLEELVAISFAPSNRNNHKACWILEFVAYEKPTWLQPHLDFFCSNLKFLTNESAIRPVAKVMQLLIKSHYKKATNSILFSEENLQNCIETSFDWLINDTKVASKVYCMRTLYILGKYYDWIYPELQIILTKDYPAHSYAYQAVAKEVLKKLK